MSSISEITEVYKEFANNNFKNFALLHTIALYPSISEQLNLVLLIKLMINLI